MEANGSADADRMLDRVDRIAAEWAAQRPELDVSPQQVIGRMHRLAANLTAELVTVYRRFGLGEGEFDVLATLRRAGPPYECAPGELAARTMVTTGAVTKRIDRLVGEGLVERRLAGGDGRRRIVALTAAGLARIDEAFAAHIENEHRLVAQLEPADRSALEAVLRRWIRHYER